MTVYSNGDLSWVVSWITREERKQFFPAPPPPSFPDFYLAPDSLQAARDFYRFEVEHFDPDLSQYVGIQLSTEDGKIQVSYSLESLFLPETVALETIDDDLQRLQAYEELQKRKEAAREHFSVPIWDIAEEFGLSLMFDTFEGMVALVSDSYEADFEGAQKRLEALYPHVERRSNYIIVCTSEERPEPFELLCTPPTVEEFQQD